MSYEPPPLSLFLPAGKVDDEQEFALGRLVDAQKVIGSLVDGGKFSGLPRDKLNQLYDLLYQASNPNGVAGTAVIDNGPEYPTKWLPPPMAAQLDARGSLNAGGIGAGALACASAACMSSELLVAGTRRVPPTLWIPAIGNAGSGKTPAHELSFAPYREREGRAAHAYATEMRQWAELDRNERKVQPKPVNDGRLSDDATIEVVARRLRGSGSLALVSDELTGLLRGIGQYKRDGGGDKARFLSLWSAEPWTYERVGSGEDPVFIYIERPIVPIFGTLQPEFLGLLGDIGSGMQARWLPHICGEREGVKLGRTSQQWRAAIDILLSTMHQRRQWRMPEDGDAFSELRMAELRWAEERGEPEQTEASMALLAKGGEHALRIALVMAEVDAAGHTEAGSPIASGELPVWAVRGGIELVDYCAAVWRTLRETGRAISHRYGDRDIVERDGLLNAWLKKRPDGSATRREIQRARVAQARTAEDVDALIARHEAVYGAGCVVAQHGGVRVYAR